ncbi:sulfatase-like hydrolase/transferase [Spiribacter salilacus]|nr:sulfatase-like hydrolase/transferase [Spiribacter salilacus]
MRVVAWVIASGMAAFALSVVLQDFHLVYRGQARIVESILSTLPAIWLFVSLASFIYWPIAAAMMLLAIYVLSEIHSLKYATTGEPLIWSDLTAFDNAGIVLHYLTPLHVVVLSGFFVILLIIGVGFRARLVQVSRPALVVAVLLFPLVFHPPLARTSETISEPIATLFETAGVEYHSWNWSLNVKQNGLLWHLLQTSQRSMPRAPTAEQAAHYQELMARKDHSAVVDEVILVFCEACWHQDYHFSDNFQPLVDRGFQQFRAISPTFGGGTVNGAFELITGLPANGALNGIIYQEYAEDIRADAHTLPAALADSGFATLSAHNNSSEFWRRDEVVPKLGFDRFIGLEQMGEQHAGWTRDYVLYDTALALRDQISGPKFFFLTTVYTHGPYTVNNDFGERDFAYKLQTSIKDLVAFTDTVLADNPDALVMVVGDHKPALNRYFRRHGILARAPRGDVPVYAYHSDDARLASMINRAEGKPFFCVAKALNHEFLGATVPAFEFSKDNRLCSKPAAQDNKALTQAYPDWLFHRILF